VNAFKRGKHGNQSIYVPTQRGHLVQRSTGTNVPSLVRGMKKMVVDLKDRHKWTVLDAIETGRQLDGRAVTLKVVYGYYVANRIDELAERLAAKNLSDSLPGWIAWVRGNRDAEALTADVYWQQVTTLVPDGGTFLATELDKARVIAWLTSRDKASSGTKRKYLYALKSFIRFLLDTGVLAFDPLAGLKAPRKNKARERYETAAVDEQIVNASNPEYRAIFAFIKATGCDVGSARRAQLGDLDLKAGTANVRGTKTDRRAVHQATVEAWAIPFLKAHTKDMVGRHTLLFPDFTNSGASHHHARICESLNIDGYTLKDARHSVAVRMRKRWATFEEIAAQLGTSVFQAVTVYSRYQPDAKDARIKEAK
jgi:integrase